MTSFTFKGFTNGALVSLLAEQGGVSDTQTVLTWNELGGPLAGLDIQIIDQSSLLAPAAVVLRADPNLNDFQVTSAPGGTPYEPWRHEITYIWRVRGEPLSFERADHLNIPEIWKDANVYYGPEVVIVFDQAADYEIDLVAVDRYGNLGTASLEGDTRLQVQNADGAFSGAGTIAVSDNADFSQAPGGATQINLDTQSWSAVNSAIAARGNSNTRVLLKAGVDFRTLVTVGEQFNFSGVTSNEIAVGSFGNGAKPIFPLPKNVGTSQDDILFRLPRDNVAGGAKIYNIDMRGAWEADKERGYIGASPLWRDIRTDVLFHRARISGHNTLETPARPGDSYFIWSDGEVTNWADMGLYLRKHGGGLKRHAVIGSDIHQHENARQGVFKTGFQNQHGAIRCEDNDSLHLHVVDLFSRNGWSTGFSSISADQPCLRVNSDGNQNAKTIGDRVAMEGGLQILKMAGQNPGTSTPDEPGNHIFDKLLTIGSPETTYHIECKMGGTTIRNGLAIEFNVPKYSGGIRTGMYDFQSDDTVIPSNNDTPVAVYNCTLVSLLSTANNRALSTSAPENVVGILDGGTFNNYDDANNITYMPNQNAVDVATPVDITTPLAGVTPRFKGTAESLQNIEVSGNGTNTLMVPYTILTDKNGNVTNQAFWQARAAAGGLYHQVRDNVTAPLFSDLPNNLSVTYESNGAHIERLDGQVFPNGSNVRIKLDQSDTLDPLDATYDISGETVPTATLAGTSNASSTFITADDFNTLPRAGRGLPGAPSGSAQKGAV